MRYSFNDIDLYPVISTREESGDEPVRILSELLKTDIRILQLREKLRSKRERHRLAGIFRKMTSEKGVLLIINDDLDIALSAGADGVHLGNDDLPVSAARSIAPDMIIGKSSHSLKEALAAEEEGADYINIGPIFKTPTKEGMNPVGLDLIYEVRKKIQIPFSVMGGIDKENIAEVLRAGADKIAMVRGMTKGDIQSRISDLYEIYRSFYGV